MRWEWLSNQLDPPLGMVGMAWEGTAALEAAADVVVVEAAAVSGLEKCRRTDGDGSSL